MSLDLGAVSYLDCLVFLLFLAPQLLWHVGLFGTVEVALRAVPFLRKWFFSYFPLMGLLVGLHVVSRRCVADGE